MKIVSDPNKAKLGDILVTKRVAGQLTPVPHKGCLGYALGFNDDKTPDNTPDECRRIQANYSCPINAIYIKVASSPEIEAARDLFALKGELL